MDSLLAVVSLATATATATAAAAAAAAAATTTTVEEDDDDEEQEEAFRGAPIGTDDHGRASMARRWNDLPGQPPGVGHHRPHDGNGRVFFTADRDGENDDGQ